MLSASHLCFFVFLLAAFQCHTQAEFSFSLDNIHDGGEGFENDTRCSWSCTVIESDFTVFAASNGLAKPVVKYEKVDEKRVNPVENVLNLIFSFYPVAHGEIKTVCKLKPTRRTTPATPFHNIDWTVPLRFIRFTHHSRVASIDCKKEEADHLQPCVNAAKSPGNTVCTVVFNIQVQLMNRDLFVFFVVLLFAFLYYPTIICFFCSSMVTENGICQMSLEGASPVSFRSLISNCLHSEVDTRWHRTRSLILRVVVLPLPFLVPATIANYYIIREQNKLLKDTMVQLIIPLFDFSQPFMLVCFACYFLQAFYDFFLNQLSHVEKPCLVCRTVKPNFICTDEVPRRILNHLRLQPLILVKCWRCLKSYFKMSQNILPSWKVSVSWFLRLAAFIVFLSTLPAVTVILLVAMPVVGIYLTSPLITLCGPKINTENSLNHTPIVEFLRGICISSLSSLAMFGASMVLAFAYVVITFAMLLSFALLLSLNEESLPSVACFVLVWYYLWNSYSAFTTKYHDLALALFKIYKTLRHDQISNEELHTEAVREVTRNPDKNGQVVRIPKKLFDMACEKLMPIREGFCLLLLKFALILSFASLIFISIMHFNVGATPVTKALVAFFTGSFPKIVTNYFDGGRKKKLDAMIVEEKAPKIVQEYINGTPRANQGQSNSGANTDVVIFVHENEENIELLSM